jgi:hypothetical protein
MTPEEKLQQVEKIKEQLQNKNLTPFIRKGLSFAKALWAQAKAPRGKRLVSPEIQKKRLDICDSCEYRGKKTCKFCSCNLSLKTLFATSACGQGSWSKEI